MPGTWPDYLNLLDQVGACLENLTALEREKTKAVLHDDLPGVDDCMKREQALSLSLRALERKRTDLLAALGFQNAPLSALADQCPPELKSQARETARRLRDRYDIYRAAADVARHTLEINLHEIEKIIERQWGGEYLRETAAPSAPGQPREIRRGGGLRDIRA